MVREYRGAIRRFRDLGLPIDEALTTIEMARLLDPAQPEVRAAADAAREILDRLGAKPFLERLMLVVQRPSPADAMAPESAGASDASSV